MGKNVEDEQGVYCSPFPFISPHGNLLKRKTNLDKSEDLVDVLVKLFKFNSIQLSQTGFNTKIIYSILFKPEINTLFSPGLYLK